VKALAACGLIGEADDRQLIEQDLATLPI